MPRDNKERNKSSVRNQEKRLPLKSRYPRKRKWTVEELSNAAHVSALSEEGQKSKIILAWVQKQE